MNTFLTYLAVQICFQITGVWCARQAWQYCTAKYNKTFVRDANKLYRLIQGYFHKREFLHADVIDVIELTCNYSTGTNQYNIKTIFVTPFNDLNYVDELFHYLIEQKIIVPCKNNYYKIAKFY